MKFYWHVWIRVRLSDLQIVVLAMLALFQLKRLKLDVNLMSFRCEKKPLPIEIRRVVLQAKFWSAYLATRYIQVCLFATASYEENKLREK